MAVRALSIVLLRLCVSCPGVAARVSRDRVESGAVPAADDPEHAREVRLRHDSGGVVYTGAHLRNRCPGGGAGSAAGHPLYRGVCFIVAFVKTRASERRDA